MALEVEKSPFDASLSAKAKSYGRWNFTELEMDYPALASKVCQLSDVEDEEPLPKGIEDEESIGVERTGCTVPGLSQRKHHKVSLTPSNRFCNIKANAKYVERQPLVSKSAYGHEVLQPFSRGGLHLEKQMKTVEGSSSTELFQDLQEVPAVLPHKAVDAQLYSPTTESLYNLDADCSRNQMPFAPYSSTPKCLSGRRATRSDAVVPAFLRSSISSQLPKDCDFEHQEMTRSKSFSASGTLSSPEISSPWYVYSLSDPKENPTLGADKRIPMDSSSLMGHVKKMSSFQADYWACAIPDTLPPSPDRQSPHWNPNKEYEDLLDYTYPLKPKYKLVNKPKCAVHDSSVNDSGVDLDSLSISPESTLKSVNVQCQEHPVTGIQSTKRLLQEPACSAPHYRLSPVGKVSFADGGPSSVSTGISREMALSLFPGGTGPGPSGPSNIDERSWNTMGHNCHTKRGVNFIRSTRVLPVQKGCSSDEEYLSLPPRLKELETLAQQLTDLSVTIRKPGHGYVQDGFPCPSVNGRHLLEGCKGDKSMWDMYCSSAHTSDSQEHDDEDLLSNARGCRDHGSMQKETASTDLLAIRCLEFLESGGHHDKQDKDYCRDSLAQRIKIFCCQLEELICWLHKVAEVTDNWTPPAPNIESVKASLQNYLEFKKDLAGHQELTKGVLQDGERLLKCMASNSPVLEKTLGLIAKQSDELESHAERLYKSVIAAMDTLGSGLMKSCDDQQSCPDRVL